MVSFFLRFGHKIIICGFLIVFKRWIRKKVLQLFREFFIGLFLANSIESYKKFKDLKVGLCNHDLQWVPNNIFLGDVLVEI